MPRSRRQKIVQENEVEEVDEDVRKMVEEVDEKEVEENDEEFVSVWQDNSTPYNSASCRLAFRPTAFWAMS